MDTGAYYISSINYSIVYPITSLSDSLMMLEITKMTLRSAIKI